MERDVRYLFVGLVVAVLAAGLIGFALWQAGRYDDRDGDRYTVFVDGAISGLAEGSVARYLGVRVGRVEAIRLSAEDSGRVEVDVRVRRDVPISTATVASIKPQGISGQSYIALRTPDPAAGAPPRRAGAPYPVIEAEPSQVEALLDAMPALVARLDNVASGLEAIVGPDNRERLNAILADTQRFAARLDGLAQSLDTLAARAGQSMDGVDGAVVEVERAASRLTPALDGLEATTTSLRRLGDRLDALLARNEGEIDRFAQVGLAEASGLLRDTRRAVNEIETLAGRLNENPSSLLHRRPAGGMEVPE